MSNSKVPVLKEKTIMYVFVTAASKENSLKTERRYLGINGGYSQYPTVKMSLYEAVRAASEYTVAQNRTFGLNEVYAVGLEEQVNVSYSTLKADEKVYTLMNLIVGNLSEGDEAHPEYKVFYEVSNGKYSWLDLDENHNLATKDTEVGYLINFMWALNRAFKYGVPISYAKVKYGDYKAKGILDLLDELVYKEEDTVSNKKETSPGSEKEWLLENAAYLPKDEDFLAKTHVANEDTKKYAFVLRDNPSFGLEWTSGDHVKDYVSLFDHDSVEQVPGIEKGVVESGPFDLDKFYVIPVGNGALTIQEYTDFVFLEGTTAGQSMKTFLDMAPSTDITEHNK